MTTHAPTINKEMFNEEFQDYELLKANFLFNGKSRPIQAFEISLNDLLILITKEQPSTILVLKEIASQKLEFGTDADNQFIDRTDYLFRWAAVTGDLSLFGLEFKTNEAGVTDLLLLVRWDYHYFSGFKTKKAYK